MSPELPGTPVAAPPADRGYRAGARLPSGGEARARRAALVAAGALVFLVALAVFDPVLTLPAVTDDDPVLPIPTIARATALPDLMRAQSFSPSKPLPILAGGLRWLDPRAGTLGGAPNEGFDGALFLDPDGSILCVCLEQPWTVAGQVVRVTLARSDGVASPADPLIVLEMTSDTQTSWGSIVVEAVISPDRSTVHLATVVPGERAATIGVTSVDAVSGTVVGRVDIPADPGLVPPPYPTIRVAPDGSELMLRLWYRAGSGGLPTRAASRALRIPVEPVSGALGAPIEVAPIFQPELYRIGCDAEGYADLDRYVEVCLGVIDGAERLSVEVLERSGEDRTIVLPASLAVASADVLVDPASGTLFAWSSARHVVARVDVATGEVTSRNYGFGGAGGAIDVGGVRPPPGSGLVAWSDLRSATEAYKPHRLAGSVDGSVLFAIGGDESGIDGLVPSSGVWVIDAATLELVDAWPPAAYYGDIALTADGEHLAALALGGVDADGRAAPWGRAVTFHRTWNGEVVELIGDIADPSGWTPILLGPRF